jgi:hypothetical protein
MTQATTPSCSNPGGERADPWIRAWAGRDVFRRNGYVAYLDLFPCPSLMRADEEGFLILVGWSIVIRLLLPAHGRRPRWPVQIEFRSDVDEITTRRARAAGVEVEPKP